MTFAIPALPPATHPDVVGSTTPGAADIDQEAWQLAVGEYPHLPEHIDSQDAWDFVCTVFAGLVIETWREHGKTTNLFEIRAYSVAQAAITWADNVGRGPITGPPTPREERTGRTINPDVLARLKEQRERARDELGVALGHPAVVKFALGYTYIGGNLVATMLGISPAQFSRMDSRPPAHLLPGTKTVRYLLGEVIEWIEQTVVPA